MPPTGWSRIAGTGRRASTAWTRTYARCRGHHVRHPGHTGLSSRKGKTLTVSSSAVTRSAEVEFVITRTFDAPRDLVFQAFSEPTRLAEWWGPKGLEITISRCEFRPG